MVEFAVAVEGLESLGEIQKLSGAIGRAAALAVNKVARDQRVVAARRIGEQINIPRRQLGPSGGRLTITEKATRTKPQARITARGRPTSLTRFVRGNPRPGVAGVTVEVKPGQAVFLRRAFLVRLPGTGGDTGANANMGLAVRLRPGERLNNKVDQVRLAKGLYLLYGPSIQQVFLDNRGEGVADDLAEPTAKKLEDEFLRVLGLNL